MSLLSETSATVLQYNNIANSVLRLGNPTLSAGGLNNVIIVGRVTPVTPTPSNNIFPLIDVQTGEPINLKGLLVNNALMESGADGPLTVNPNNSINFILVGTDAAQSGYSNYDNASSDNTGINNKFYAETCDGSTYGGAVTQQYPIPAIRVEQAVPPTGAIVSGSIVVTLNCVSF